jgi:hypothetical protein
VGTVAGAGPVRRSLRGQALALRGLHDGRLRVKLHGCAYFRMPEISRFLGIVIAMYYRDHAPPHFHAIYGEYEVTIQIATGKDNGEFPRRALVHASSGVRPLR